MRPSNTIGKHTRANSHAHTICKGKNRCTDSNLSLESLSDLFGEEEYRAGYLSVKVLIKMEMPRIKSKSERGEIAQ